MGQIVKRMNEICLLGGGMFKSLYLRVLRVHPVCLRHWMSYDFFLSEIEIISIGSIWGNNLGNTGRKC